MEQNKKEKEWDDLNNYDINKYKFEKNKNYLVVNGKVKEIGAKSQYLLDMLIIEDN
jgi:hypothetical protein